MGPAAADDAAASRSTYIGGRTNGSSSGGAPRIPASTSLAVATIAGAVGPNVTCNSPGPQRQLMLHVQRLNDYIDNPLNMDNQGTLANAINNGVGDPNRIYDGRVNSLINQVNSFRRLIEENR